MTNQGELWPEAVFEVIWHQHNLDDWMAEIRDARTDQSCQVYSLAEFEQFIQTHLQIVEPRPAELEQKRCG